MEVNSSVNVVDNNLACALYVYKINSAFTAAHDDSTVYGYIINTAVTRTDTVCKYKVAVDCNVFKCYTGRTDDNRTCGSNTAVCTGLTYVSLEYIMEYLCKFFSCDLALGTECSVFIAVEIFISDHTCQCIL